MSRLDSAIRRLESQKTCIEYASTIIRNFPGVIIEIGLGNGRTYDHLREIFPKRKIYVFERDIKAHPDCIPPDEFLYKGDYNKTLIKFRENIINPVIMVHFDIGSGNKYESLERSASLSLLLKNIVEKNGLIVGDQPLNSNYYKELSLPKSVKYGRYYLYKLN